MAQPSKQTGATQAPVENQPTPEPTAEVTSQVADVKATDTAKVEEKPSTPILAAVAAAERTPTEAVEVKTVDGEKYETRGRTHVATLSGTEFHVEGAPPITPDGIYVTVAEANALYNLADRYGVTLLVTSPNEQTEV